MYMIQRSRPAVTCRPTQISKIVCRKMFVLLGNQSQSCGCGSRVAVAVAVASYRRPTHCVISLKCTFMDFGATVTSGNKLL